MQPPIICVDFETYYYPGSGYTLKKMTTEEYICDPQFQVIGVGVLENGEPPSGEFPIWMEETQFREYIAYIERKYGWSNVAVLAHHAHFDGRILGYHFNVFPGFWFDTLCMAVPLHGAMVGGSLAKLMKYYEVGEKGTEVVNAMGKRRENFTAEEWARYGVYCEGDCRGEWAIFQKMLPGFPEDELRLIDMTIRFFTEPVLVLDEPAMKKALVDEIARKDKLMREIADDPSVVKQFLMSNEKFAELLVRLGVDPPMKWSVKKEREDYAFAKSDPGMQELAEHDDPQVRALVAARLGVKTTIAETRTARMLKLGAGGRAMPLYLRYCGAHTWRWSGSDKMNPQNWEKVDEEKGKGQIRKAILAPEGKAVVVADAAQIEARLLAWISEEKDVLQAFCEGRDLYSEDASEYYGRTITKADKIERFVGKTTRLGLGYGMGVLKFAQQMSVGMLGGAPVIFGENEVEVMSVDLGRFITESQKIRNRNLPSTMERIEAMPSRIPLEKRIVHCAVADHIVKKYRSRNTAIVGYWQTAEEMLQLMVDGYEEEFRSSVGNHLVLKTVRHGLQLPSGLTLKYPDLEAKTDDEGNTRFSFFNARYKQREHIYGGKFVENQIQALARISVSDQMLKAQDAGMKIATMTHDEIVAVVPEEEAESCLAQLIQIMKTPSPWCPDITLSAEGGFGKSYGEAK